MSNDNEMNNRIQMVVDGIYENEGMAANLNDEAAAEFLKWAADQATEIVKTTVGQTEEEAEESMYPQLKALRKVARYLGQCAARENEPEDMIDRILENGPDLYGIRFEAPSEEARQAFIDNAKEEKQLEMVQALKMALKSREE